MDNSILALKEHKPLYTPEILYYIPHDIKIYAPYLIYSGNPPEPSHEEYGPMTFTLEMFIQNNKNNTLSFPFIMRPLNELQFTINHNGEEFVPIDRICELEDCRTEYNYNHTKCKVDEIIKHGIQPDTPFSIVMKLIEWHFDVFDYHNRNLCIYYNQI